MLQFQQQWHGMHAVHFLCHIEKHLITHLACVLTVGTHPKNWVETHHWKNSTSYTTFESRCCFFLPSKSVSTFSRENCIKKGKLWKGFSLDQDINKQVHIYEIVKKSPREGNTTMRRYTATFKNLNQHFHKVPICIWQIFSNEPSPSLTDSVEPFLMSKRS